jgi:hypothetical protein
MSMKDVYGNYQIDPDTSGAGSSTPVGGGPTASSGTADPNTLSLPDSVLIYNQFDGSNNFVAQWERDPTGTFV